MYYSTKFPKFQRIAALYSCFLKNKICLIISMSYVSAFQVWHDTCLKNSTIINLVCGNSKRRFLSETAEKEDSAPVGRNINGGIGSSDKQDCKKAKKCVVFSITINGGISCV